MGNKYTKGRFSVYVTSKARLYISDGVNESQIPIYLNIPRDISDLEAIIHFIKTNEKR